MNIYQKPIEYPKLLNIKFSNQKMSTYPDISIKSCNHPGWLSFHVLNRLGPMTPVLLESLCVRISVTLLGACLNHINGDNNSFMIRNTLDRSILMVDNLHSPWAST